MPVESALFALGDPTRRRIFDSLRTAPQTVGELAQAQPVSRPAVSQHLKVLQEANLVQVQPQGTRRLYLIRREGLEELRDYLNGFWSDVLAGYGAEVVRQTALDVDTPTSPKKPRQHRKKKSN